MKKYLFSFLEISGHDATYFAKAQINIVKWSFRRSSLAKFSGISVSMYENYEFEDEFVQKKQHHSMIFILCHRSVSNICWIFN